MNNKNKNNDPMSPVEDTKISGVMCTLRLRLEY